MTNRQSGSYTPRLAQNEGEIVAEILSGTNRANVSIVRVESNLGDRIQSRPTRMDGHEYCFKGIFLNGATTVDITFAVHQSQFVEFMVKPELGTNQAKAKK